MTIEIHHNSILLALPEFENFAENLKNQFNTTYNLNIKHESVVFHEFPDKEIKIQCLFQCTNKHIIIVTSLHNPNKKILPLLFLAQTCRELGAKSIGLLCPYLAYMRQDTRFDEGESISASYFAKILSNYIDWLVTVDPHLHRIKNLSEIYSIPTQVLHATGLMSEWIQDHVAQPLLIGPDQESIQWVQQIAAAKNYPYVILKKHRQGDQLVTITLPDMSQWPHHTPVLVDDVISSGITILRAIEGLAKLGYTTPICIATHGIFAKDAYNQLCKTKTRIVTTNSIPHVTNKIDLVPWLAKMLSICN